MPDKVSISDVTKLDNCRKHCSFVVRFQMWIYHFDSKNRHVVRALRRLFIVLYRLCALRTSAPLYVSTPSSNSKFARFLRLSSAARPRNTSPCSICRGVLLSTRQTSATSMETAHFPSLILPSTVQAGPRDSSKVLERMVLSFTGSKRTKMASLSTSSPLKRPPGMGLIAFLGPECPA